MEITTKLYETTYSTITPFLSPILTPIKPIIETVITPIVVTRPKEILVDTIEYAIPFSSQTNACINYIKRRIRLSVWNKDKKNGIVSFAIDPKKSWLLDLSRVEIDVVVSKINAWLSNMHSINEAYPKRITWMEHQPLKSKVNHGDQFIVHFWWGQYLTLENSVSESLKDE